MKTFNGQSIMKFLKKVFRHRYRIDKVKNESSWQREQYRYVVRERPWWCFAFPVYICIEGQSNFNTLREALEAIERDKVKGPNSKTVYKN